MTGNNTKVRSLFLAALVVFSVFAGSIAFAGGAAAQGAQTAFQGQTVTYTDSNIGSGETITVVADDGTVEDQFIAQQNGSVTIDTSDISTGVYSVNDEQGNDLGDLRVSTQSFNVSFDPASVQTGTSSTVVVDSNRVSFTATVTSDDGGVASAFVDTNSNMDGVQVDIQGDDIVSGTNVSNLSAGEYTFDFDVTDTTAEASATLNVGQTGGDVVEFNKSVVTEVRGGIASIPVDFENANSATLVLGGSDVGYTVNVNFTNTGDDKQATLLFNTYNRTFSIESGSITTSNNTSDEILDAADYDLSLRQGSTESDVGTLVINERSTESFEINSAPFTADLDDAEAIENASVDSNTVTEGNYIIHKLEATGLDGVIADAGGLQALNNSGAISVTMVQQDPGPNTDANRIDVFNNSGTSIVAGEDVYYIVVDSSQLDVETGDEYMVSFSIPEDSPLGEASLNDTFTLQDPSFSLDTEEVDGEEQVTVNAEANQTITGTTNYGEGTQVRVIVRSTGDNPFLLDDTATVGEDGTFAAEFDFSDYSANTTFTVEARTTNAPTTLSDSANGVINPARTAEVSISDQESDGSTVTVDSATLSEGGFVTIHDGSLLDGAVFDSIRGTSDYLDAGEHSDIEITLDTPYNESGTVIPMAHMDTNGNEEYDFPATNGSEDGPYTTSGGDPVIDDAELTVSNMSMNGTASVTIEDQDGDGSTVTVASASLPEGGFVTIHDDTLLDGAVIDSVRGTSEYLEAGNQTDLSITLDTPYEESGTVIAMPHMDTNDNQQYDFVTSEGSADGPYTSADGAPLTDDAELTVGDNGTSMTGTTSAPQTSEEPGSQTTEAPVTDDSETEPPASDTTSNDGPGFGIVVALIALVAAALLAVRRDD